MSASGLEQLLVVQEHDTHMTQLRRRRETLPERTELSAAEATLADLAARRTEVGGRRDTLARNQQRIDDDVTLTRDRSATADRTLYGGTVSNPRELQALQDEIASLARRITQLEDQELEVMAEIEPLESDLATTAGEAEVAEAVAAGSRIAITAAEAEIGAELDAEQAARAAAAADVDPDLLAEYEQIRSRGQGVGIARLVGGTCGGCHLKLSAVELDRLRGLDPDDLVHCEECGRLLVR